MKNVFSPKQQIDDQQAKIIASIERLSTLFKSNLQDTAKKYKLTPLQTQLLIFIDEHHPNLCSVTLLSEEFSVTKATISDSAKTLVNKGYLTKVSSRADARAFHFEIADSAKSMLTELSKFGQSMATVLQPLQNSEIDTLSELTLKMIHLFQQQDLIPTRMCYACRFYSPTDDGFHCELMKADLDNNSIRLDCPEFQGKGIRI